MTTDTSAAPARHVPLIPEIALSDRLRIARRHAGLDQRAISSALGVPQTTYSAWERGAARPGDVISIAQQVEELTGVSSEWLLGLVDESGNRKSARRNSRQPLLAKWQRGSRTRPGQGRHRYAVNARALRRHVNRMDVADIRRKAWRAHLSSMSFTGCADQMVGERTIRPCKDDDTVRLARETTRTTAS